MPALFKGLKSSTANWTGAVSNCIRREGISRLLPSMLLIVLWAMLVLVASLRPLIECPAITLQSGVATSRRYARDFKVACLRSNRGGLTTSTKYTAPAVHVTFRPLASQMGWIA